MLLQASNYSIISDVCVCVTYSRTFSRESRGLTQTNKKRALLFNTFSHQILKQTPNHKTKNRDIHTLRVWSNCPKITSAAFKVLSILSCALRIECVLIYHHITTTKSNITTTTTTTKTLKKPKTWSNSHYLSRTHCGFKRRKTMIKRTKNRNHVIGNGLAFVKRVFNERCSFV